MGSAAETYFRLRRSGRLLLLARFFSAARASSGLRLLSGRLTGSDSRIAQAWSSPKSQAFRNHLRASSQSLNSIPTARRFIPSVSPASAARLYHCILSSKFVLETVSLYLGRANERYGKGDDDGSGVFRNSNVKRSALRRRQSPNNLPPPVSRRRSRATRYVPLGHAAVSCPTVRPGTVITYEMSPAIQAFVVSLPQDDNGTASDGVGD